MHVTYFYVSLLSQVSISNFRWDHDLHVYLILYACLLDGIMTCIFIGLWEANNAVDNFQVLWVFFACFCVVVVGIVLVSIRQYHRSRVEAREKASTKKEAEGEPTPMEEARTSLELDSSQV